MAVIAVLDVLLRAQTKKFDAELKQSQAKVSAFARSLKIMGGATGAAFAAAAAMRKIASVTTEFNSAMAKSTAIMSNLTDTMRDDLAATADKVAATTIFSNSEAAESYFFLASAGMSAAESLEALPKVAKFAQAGMFDMATATDLLTDAVSALGMSDDAFGLERVSDVLVKANTQANASVEQFSRALTTKAGTALRQLGKDVEEGVAVLSVFADQGVKAEEAGTALNIVLRDMSTKAIGNADAFKALGIRVFDQQGEFRNLADVIKDMESALAGMNDEQRKGTLLALGFSDKSVAFTSALLGTSEQIREYEFNLRQAGGITNKVANNTIPEFNKAISRMKANLVAFVRTQPLSNFFGNDMGIILNSVLDQFKRMGEALDEIAEKAKIIFRGLKSNAPAKEAGSEFARRDEIRRQIALQRERAEKGEGEASIFGGRITTEARRLLEDKKRAEMQRSLAEKARERLAKANAELISKAAEITDELKNPLEIYKEKIQELKKLRSRIGEDFFRRGVAAAAADFKRATEVKPDKTAERAASTERKRRRVEESLAKKARSLAEDFVDSRFKTRPPVGARLADTEQQAFSDFLESQNLRRASEDEARREKEIRKFTTIFIARLKSELPVLAAADLGDS